MKIEKKVLEKAKWKFLLMTYPAAILLGLLFLALLTTGRIKVRNWRNFPKWTGRIVLYANHPSLWEPIILPALFFWQYLWSPGKYAPWSAPDTKNYGRNLLYFAFRERHIYVPRGDKQGEKEAYKKMLAVLNAENIVVLHPEGGRTSSSTDKIFVYSAKGKIIRPFKNGIGHLIKQTDAIALPVWVEGSDKILPRGSNKPRIWRKMTITIGLPIVSYPDWQGMPEYAGRKNADRITKFLEQKLLELADEN